MTKHIKLSNQAIISQIEGNIVSDMDGEKVMLSIDNGKYYNLGELGGTIWEYINEPLYIEELIEKLLDQYDVEKEVCEQQVKEFISQLAEQGLVRINAHVRL